MEQLKQLERLHALKPGLVRSATELAKSSSLPKKSQLQNLRTMATGAGCVEEITNFLYYQSSREGGAERWARNVVKDIERVLNDTCNQAKADRVPPMEAARLFVGFFVRAAVAKTGGPDE